MYSWNEVLDSYIFLSAGTWATVLPEESRISPAIKYPRAVIIITSFSKSTAAIMEWYAQQHWNYSQVHTHSTRKAMTEVLQGLYVFLCCGGFSPQIQMPLLPNFKKPWIKGTLKNIENQWFQILPTVRNITLRVLNKWFFLVCGKILFSKSSFFILDPQLHSHFHIPPASHSPANSNNAEQ